MIEYKTPTSDVFHNRQQFYTMQKLESEDISSWLQRLQNFIKLCDFEELTDFLLIDKFISALSDFDFEKVSPFATWTVEKLMLMASDDIHSTGNFDVNPNPHTNEILSVYIKSEIDIDDIYVANSNDDLQIDDVDETTNEVRVSKRKTRGRPRGEKCLTGKERRDKYITKLKESGQYEEYKRRQRLRNAANKSIDIHDIYVVNSNDDLQIDDVDEPSNEVSNFKSHKRKTGGRPKGEKCMTGKERWNKYITKLKESGQYEEYKRRQRLRNAANKSNDIDDIYVENSNDDLQNDDVDEPLNEVSDSKTHKRKPRGRPKGEKCMTGKERRDKYITKLKESGQYEEYKRRQRLRNAANKSNDIDDIYVANSNDDLQIDDVDEPSIEVSNSKTHKRKRRGRPKGEKCMTAKERRDKYIEKLKESDQYEEYKRRQKLRQATNKSTVYECHLCLTNFEKSNELKVHLTVEHQQAKRPVLQCPHCPKTTSSREVLAQHVNKLHNDIVTADSPQKLHKCPCCEKEFTSLGLVNEHLISHPDYRPFICETCASTFKSLDNLNSHLRKHNKEKPFKCEECGKQFNWKLSFKDHMLMHRGETPYPCKLCQKSFRQMSHLKRHLVAVHNPEAKPYVCSICSKSYVSLCQLNVHSRNHTGDKPYQCDQCDRAFTQNSSLKTHLKIHAAKALKKRLDEDSLENHESNDTNIVK